MLKVKIIDSIASSAAAIAALRRDIHAHPELCFQEVRTAEVVAQKLTDWGLAVHRGLGTTGVVGILDVDWPGALSAAALATLVSLLTSVSQAEFTAGTPAFEAQPDDYEPRHRVAD